MKRYLRSFGFALEGILETIRSERNFRTHIVVAAIAVAFGFYVGLSPLGWCVIVICIGAVMAAELFNTAIEKLGDGLADGRREHNVKLAKDASAGAVFLLAVASVVIGVLLLLIPAIEKVSRLF
jgi:diacylglycerol kinase